MNRLIIAVLFAVAAVVSGAGFMFGAMAHDNPSPRQARWQRVVLFAAVVSAVLSVIGFIVAWIDPGMAARIGFGPAICVVIYVVALNRLYSE